VPFNIAYPYSYIFILAWNWDSVYWCNVMQYTLINLPITQTRCPVAFADVLWFSWTDEAVRLLVNNQIEYYFNSYRNESHFEMSWNRGGENLLNGQDVTRYVTRIYVFPYKHSENNLNNMKWLRFIYFYFRDTYWKKIQVTKYIIVFTNMTIIVIKCLRWQFFDL